MEDIMACRMEQVSAHGHTPDADLALPLTHFAGQLHRRVRDIAEDTSCHQRPDIIRRRLVKMAALTMAMIDRIDGEEQARQQPD